MFGSLSTEFRKMGNGEDSSDPDIGEKQLVQEVKPAIDAGPGGLSFEEGSPDRPSRLPVILGLTGILPRCCWRAWSSSRCHIMHTSYRRTYHRHRHLLDPVIYSERSRLHRGLTHALGPRICSFFLRIVHLARVRDHVSPQWWRKGLFGGRLSETEVPCYGGVCYECDLPWIHREWVYRKCRLDIYVCGADLVW